MSNSLRDRTRIAARRLGAVAAFAAVGVVGGILLVVDADGPLKVASVIVGSVLLVGGMRRLFMYAYALAATVPRRTALLSAPVFACTLVGAIPLGALIPGVAGTSITFLGFFVGLAGCVVCVLRVLERQPPDPLPETPQPLVVRVSRRSSAVEVIVLLAAFAGGVFAITVGGLELVIGVAATLMFGWLLPFSVLDLVGIRRPFLELDEEGLTTPRRASPGAGCHPMA